jgi:TPR repeat protein
MTWFVKSADAENDKAMNAIGNIYQKGQGVTVDYANAAKWYRSAASLGNQPAMFNLGVIYEQGLGVPADAEEARKWYAKAAEPTTPSRP